MSRVLIVVDMQNDFVTGSLGSQEAQKILPKVREKIRQYETQGDRIIFTRDTHGEDYLNTAEGKKLPVKHCIKGTEGWQIVPELERPDCQYVDKPTFGWLSWDDFGKEDRIELIGVCTDICVISNALILKAKYPDAEVVVDAECCAGLTREKHQAALEVMKSCQIDVVGEENEYKKGVSK